MDVDKLKAILAALQGTDVTRITWSEGQETIDLRLGHPPAAVQTAPVATAPIAAPMSTATPPSVAPVAAPAPAAAAPNNSFTVNSPFVGTFYRSASPDSPSFVDVGQMVK